MVAPPPFDPVAVAIFFRWAPTENVVRFFAIPDQGCQMAKFDPFLSLDCAWVEGVSGGAIQGKEGIKFCSLT